MRELLRLLPYALRSAVRARTRSLVTLLGAALALGLYAFLATVDRAVAVLAEDREQPLLVVFQDSRFCPLTSELPLRYADGIRQVPGVKAVLPTLLYVNSCRSNLDLVTLHGVPATDLASVHRLQVLAGALADFQVRADGVLVGERLAERRRARVGERLRLGEVDLQVCGIVGGVEGGIANLAFVHLDLLARARQRQGTVTQFLVRLQDGARPEPVAAQIDQRFHTDQARTDTRTMQAFVAAAVGEIVEVVAFARLLGLLAVAVLVLLLANTVSISAWSRAAELGLLETLGLGRGRQVALIAGEGLGLGLLGGLLGSGIVLLILWRWPVTLGIEGHGIDLLPAWSVVGRGAVVASLAGGLASVPPALAVVRAPLHLRVRGE